jgi:hypothetical protein
MNIKSSKPIKMKGELCFVINVNKPLVVPDALK